MERDFFVEEEMECENFPCEHFSFDDSDFDTDHYLDALISNYGSLNIFLCDFLIEEWRLYLKDIFYF